MIEPLTVIPTLDFRRAPLHARQRAPDHAAGHTPGRQTGHTSNHDLPRADHIGTLLRPKMVRDLRNRGVFDFELTLVEDMAIRDLVQLQKALGLKVATDGEVRHRYGGHDFLAGLTGLDAFAPQSFQPCLTDQIDLRLTGALDFPADHPMLQHFSFVQDLLRPGEGLAKISIPSPASCHDHILAAKTHHPAYRDPAQLFHEVARTYMRAVQAFHDAGCRYLQFDDRALADLAEPGHRAALRAKGQNPDAVLRQYIDLLDAAIRARPDDMRIGLYLGGGPLPDSIADAIFNHTSVDVYFLPFDTERREGLATLRLLPKGDKRVMAGLIDARTDDLERLDMLRVKIDSAAKYIDLDQLGIAPCQGFAAAPNGDALTEDVQMRKLELLVRTADAIWGET